MTTDLCLRNANTFYHIKPHQTLSWGCQLYPLKAQNEMNTAPTVLPPKIYFAMDKGFQKY